MFHIAQSDKMPELPSDMSEQARDLLHQCLERDPSLRPTAVDLLEHPFFRDPTTPRQPSSFPTSSSNARGSAPRSPTRGQHARTRSQTKHAHSHSRSRSRSRSRSQARKSRSRADRDDVYVDSSQLSSFDVDLTLEDRAPPSPPAHQGQGMQSYLQHGGHSDNPRGQRASLSPESYLDEVLSATGGELDRVAAMIDDILVDDPRQQKPPPRRPTVANTSSPAMEVRYYEPYSPLGSVSVEDSPPPPASSARFDSSKLHMLKKKSARSPTGKQKHARW
jgi:serine/threonine protein kinase